MKKLNMTINEVITLHKEINGFVNPETKEVIFHGLLKQKLPIILKYELSTLNEFLNSENDKIEAIKKELIQKYGEKDEKEGIFLPFYLNNEEGKRQINPKFIEFEKEFSELLNTEIEVDVPEITTDVLRNSGETTDNYTVLFKLVK